MSKPQKKLVLGGLAKRLVSDGLISEQQAVEVVEESREKNTSLVSIFIQKGLVNGHKIASISAEEFGLPVLDLSAFDFEFSPKELITPDLIAKHRAIPLMQHGNRLFVGISDPTNLIAVDEFKFSTGIATEAVIVEDGLLEKYIEKFESAAETSMDDLIDDEDLDNLDIIDEEAEQNKKEENDAASAADETPVVRFVNKVLLDAIKKGASDIHLEMYEKKFRVRFRIDGILQEVANPPLSMASRLVARIKVMSRMDISEKRIPQDGRIKLKLSKTKSIDFRVSTCPVLFGEKIVLRILDPSSAQLGIEALGYEPAQEKLYLDALAKPYGMILVTGPTGSGKTVSLYTGVNILNVPETNISTAEDPAEINLEGVNQVNVNPKAGLTFEKALKAFLRQDPDVILVGEIRDIETASIAIKAAQTGHLVLSTLHTNDAPQTLSRLVNMGVAPFNIATAVTLVIAQRLGRRLCKHCKVVDDVPDDVLLEAGYKQEELPLKLYKPVGCDQCAHGYKGRVGIYQVMPISDKMGRIVMDGGNAIDIADQAELDGVQNLRRSALNRVAEGITSLEEANRITLD